MDNSTGSNSVPSTPEDAAQRIKDAAGSVLDHTKQAAAEQATRAKDSVASSVQTAASSLRRAADETEGENALIGKALRSFADGLDKASSTIGDGDLNRTLQSVNDFARREPAIFLGASFALGFALSRVGKAALEQTSAQSAVAGRPPRSDGVGG